MEFNCVDFLICGAAKAGTTTLFECLSTHPDIAPSRKKEPNFFCDNKEMGTFHKGWDWYNELFVNAKAGQKRFEASTLYMYHIGSESLLHRYLPQIKLIFILRNPIDRVYSNYWEDRKRGACLPEFKTLLDRNDQHYQHYVNISCYGKHLKRWSAYFSKEQILIIDFDKMKENLHRVLEAACGFIGVDSPSSYTSEIFNIKPANVSALPRSRWLACLYYNGLLRELIDQLPYTIGDIVRDFGLIIKQMVFKKNHYPALPNDCRTKMMRDLRQDIDQLEQLLEMSFDHWK